MIKINNDWDDFLEQESKKDYYLKLRSFLINEYNNKIIYPDKFDIFNALKYTSYKNTKVVIIGQDQYINTKEAHGLAFSVQPQSSIPPSLRNIFIELKSDLNCYIPNNGYLVKWAEQGVLLLNRVLTVEHKKSKSHAKHGWEEFTRQIIMILNNRHEPIVFLLWGRDAKNQQEYITNNHHLVLTAAHQSPLAGGAFAGCRHFSKTNNFLEYNSLKVIDWQIDNI